MLKTAQYSSNPISNVIVGREDYAVPRTVVSANIAIRNEERHIESVLTSLLRQDAPDFDLQLIVVDGDSDALSAAGGTTPRAGKSVTIAHRDHPEAAETMMLSSPDGQKMTNVGVLPGDTIVVSKAGIVYVVGDVKEPTGIIMDNPRFTVLQAIAMAHGTNSTASMGSTKLIRTVDGVPKEIPIPLNKILSAQSTDLALQADDIVFVPNSKVKTVTHKGLEAALQAATGVAIYGRY
jgi:polysaccharide export outer membrane protein